MPLSGLVLNATVRPHCLENFTYRWLSFMAVVAGLALLPPTRCGGWRGLVAWWGRWVAATFAGYFFVRFLPGLWMTPFAWLSALTMGSAEPFPEGTLMIAPFLLFQHWQRDVAELWDALLWECNPWRLAAIALAGAWALPACAVWQALGGK